MIFDLNGKRKYKLFAFDFDLTIADTVKIALINYTETLAEFGLKYDGDVFADLSRPLDKTFEEKVKPLDPDADYGLFEAAFYRSVERHFRSVALYPDVLPFFKGIKSSGGRIALVTNRIKPSLSAALEKYPDINQTIDFYSTSDMTDRLKPLPDPLIIAMNALGSEAEETIYFGDALNDELCAKAAGVDFVYVDRTGRIDRDGSIKTFDELTSHL